MRRPHFTWSQNICCGQLTVQYGTPILENQCNRASTQCMSLNFWFISVVTGFKENLKSFYGPSAKLLVKAGLSRDGFSRTTSPMVECWIQRLETPQLSLWVLSDCISFAFLRLPPPLLYLWMVSFTILQLCDLLRMILGTKSSNHGYQTIKLLLYQKLF